MIPGNHFFLRSRHEQIVKAISAELLPVLVHDGLLSEVEDWRVPPLLHFTVTLPLEA